jgi:hypothetical protein
LDFIVKPFARSPNVQIGQCLYTKWFYDSSDILAFAAPQELSSWLLSTTYRKFDMSKETTLLLVRA